MSFSPVATANRPPKTCLSPTNDDGLTTQGSAPGFAARGGCRSKIQGNNPMARSARSRAEQQFAATQKKKNKQVLKEREKAEQERAEHRAYLRGLRLAKEAADKESAAAMATEKEARKAAKKTVAVGSRTSADETPQAHRRTN